jgi:hypothetical protein
MRKYVLHGSERVYFEDSPQHYEVLCTQCGAEVPEGRVFWLLATITRPELPPIEIRTADYGAAPFHEGCVTSCIARELAGLASSQLT